MITRPEHLGRFQFVILCSQRAAQLIKGCVPTIDGGTHKKTVVAQMEVSAGTIGQYTAPPVVAGALDEGDVTPETELVPAAV